MSQPSAFGILWAQTYLPSCSHGKVVFRLREKLRKKMAINGIVALVSVAFAISVITVPAVATVITRAVGSPGAITQAVPFFTTLSSSPTVPNGSGWYTANPSISLSISEPGTTYYSWDSTASYSPYATPFGLPSEGAHKLYYYSESPASTNVALNMPAYASSSWPDSLPAEAFNGIAEGPHDGWNSGGDPPAWVYVDLLQERNLAQMRLFVDQTPDGTTTHNIYTSTDTVNWALAKTLDGYTYKGQLITADFSPPISDARYIKVETISSPSWVGWTEIEAYESTQKTEPAQSKLYQFDATEPTASIKINGGADVTADPNVTLNLSASDGAGSGPDKMRFREERLMHSLGNIARVSSYYLEWSDWEPYSTSKTWTLFGGDYEGIFFQVKDKAGNVSEEAWDWIGFDAYQPEPTLETPFISTKISKTTTFTVRWGAYVYWADGELHPDSGVSYTVRYRPSTSSTWRRWKSNTKSTYGYFPGKAGASYFFRVKAIDGAGNIGWSKVAKTIVPFNEDTYYGRTGFYAYNKDSTSQNYLSSVRCSYSRGHNIRYKLYNSNGIGLVVTKGPNMGKAKIYVDGEYVKTVDAYSLTTKARQLIYYKGFLNKGTHWLKVVNQGTPGRAKFEIDGVVSGQ